MILSAISHDATARDCFCLEPDRFVFRLRCAKGDIASVVLHHQDKYLPLGIQDTRGAVSMHLAASDHTLDHWQAELTFHLVCLRYWFEITDKAGNTVYYSNHHFSQVPFADTDDMFDCPQNLREEERFFTPEWAENQVIYQVFPSRFASSQPVPEEIWYKAPVTHWDNLHGDLKGVTAHLEHLKELGVDILYMTPIFHSNSCHKYDTIDYYAIDPSFGTEQDLKNLVDRAHSLGLKVILDGVFNHTAPEFFAFADIREKGASSKYLDWYFIDGFPLRAKWGEKPNFKTFSYFGGMPKLNVKNPEVSRYILDVALYWLRRCGIDGWRLDVGDEIGHSFWKQFRREIKKEFPQALIIGEVWHLAEDFLQGDEWDTVMNYPFYQAVKALAQGEERALSRLASEMGLLKGRLHPKVLPLLWNLSDSHDTPRLLHLCGGDKDKMKLIAGLQLLSPGMPMIYYGDEYAMDGGQDPDCRRGMLWDRKRQDGQMYCWYRKLLRLRKEHPELLCFQAQDIADDEQGLLLRQVNGRTLVFHCKPDTVTLPELAGKHDLLTEAITNGAFGPYAVAVLE